MPMSLGFGLGIPNADSAPTEAGGDIPEGFAAVTQDGQTVTHDGDPVYVAE